jgi:hypothetical protein
MTSSFTAVLRDKFLKEYETLTATQREYEAASVAKDPPGPDGERAGWRRFELAKSKRKTMQGVVSEAWAAYVSERDAA